MKKYMCLICGYIYDEEVGAPDEGIPAGTRWEDVPPNWTCPECGRSYDSGQIPADEYAQIRRVQLRFRAVPIALGLVVAALAIFFTLTGNPFSIFILLPLSAATWFAFIRPLHRRRYRAAIADLPRWNLRAD